MCSDAQLHHVYPPMNVLPMCRPVCVGVQMQMWVCTESHRHVSVYARFPAWSLLQRDSIMVYRTRHWTRTQETSFALLFTSRVTLGKSFYVSHFVRAFRIGINPYMQSQYNNYEWIFGISTNSRTSVSTGNRKHTLTHTYMFMCLLVKVGRYMLAGVCRDVWPFVLMQNIYSYLLLQKRGWMPKADWSCFRICSYKCGCIFKVYLYLIYAVYQYVQ